MPPKKDTKKKDKKAKEHKAKAKSAAVATVTNKITINNAHAPTKKPRKTTRKTTASKSGVSGSSNSFTASDFVKYYSAPPPHFQFNDNSTALYNAIQSIQNLPKQITDSLQTPSKPLLLKDSPEGAGAGARPSRRESILNSTQFIPSTTMVPFSQSNNEVGIMEKNPEYVSLTSSPMRNEPIVTEPASHKKKRQKQAEIVTTRANPARQCQFCNHKAFKNNSSFHSHMRKKHPDEYDKSSIDYSVEEA